MNDRVPSCLLLSTHTMVFPRCLGRFLHECLVCCFDCDPQRTGSAGRCYHTGLVPGPFPGLVPGQTKTSLSATLTPLCSVKGSLSHILSALLFSYALLCFRLLLPALSEPVCFQDLPLSLSLCRMFSLLPTQILMLTHIPVLSLV